jgi:hypothetical protein
MSQPSLPLPEDVLSYIYTSLFVSRPEPVYLRIEQAVLQLSLGKLTGLGGGGAGGE